MTNGGKTGRVTKNAVTSGDFARKAFGFSVGFLKANKERSYIGG
jgi:hypothetical protein